MAEMYTSQSVVLNCELYKDIDELRSENKIFHSKLAVSEDADGEGRVQDIHAIQKFSVKAQKQAELKLKVCEVMAHAKHKELTEVLAELSKAKELLTKLGVSSYADPKVSAVTFFLMLPMF
ncbi:hypothetical protein Fot_24276 [Forsythia ovata]|uniref:Uncharacterized protein n=1 Tax=Forsythia ovata TaxID=205694 RepID=A0ABD1U6U6_9LAMI